MRNQAESMLPLRGHRCGGCEQVYFPQARGGEEKAQRATVAACFPQHDDDVVLLQLTGGPAPLAPEQIAMVYWFANFPNKPARFLYSTAKFQMDWDSVNNIVEEINAAKEFPLSEDEHPCRFCTYRSYCDRGVKAANWDEVEAEEEEEENFEIDFEQIGEIAF